jgi:TPR repeat protein
MMASAGCAAGKAAWTNFRAKLGNTGAQCDLGHRYLKGDGVRPNSAEALRWFRAAEKAGDICGVSGQGNIYFYGLGVEPDEAKGIKLWRRAAAVDYPSALAHLGDLYLTGCSCSIKRDKALGLVLSQKAWDRGFLDAGVSLGRFYMERGAPGDFAVAQKYLLAAYNDGDDGAGTVLGQLNFGAGKYQDAFKWFMKTSWSHNSQGELGFMYYKGLGVSRDYVRARYWYERAVISGGNADAEFSLALMYERGLGGPRDEADAMALYRISAAQNSVQALVKLGEHSLNSAITPQGTAEGMAYLEKAARLGSSDAQLDLGMLLKSGLGGRQDLPAAYRWYTVALGSRHLNPRQRGYFPAKRDELGRQLTSEQRAEADRSAAALLSKLGSEEW